MSIQENGSQTFVGALRRQTTTIADVTNTLEYDATGLLCPLPVLRANRKLRELPVGGLLTVRATDPAAEQDFPAYCRQTGHELVSTAREGEVLVFVIRKR
jgi:tRNA 2-thiouridine synthesizing protein A